jgi:DUF971 family protein
MAGAHVPIEIKLHQKSRVMEISEPVGSYAVQPVFSDGDSTGIYSWDYLYELGQNQDALWSQYLSKLKAAGASRD